MPSPCDEKCHNGIIKFGGFRDSHCGNCPPWQLQHLLIIKAVPAVLFTKFVSLIFYCFKERKETTVKVGREAVS